MRNLKEYPITREEKIAALDHAIEVEEATQKIGGIRPAALRAIQRDITESQKSEPRIKELVWECKNWWYAHSILGLYEFKNWWMSQDGPAWLYLPGKDDPVPCKTISEARAVAQAHFSEIIRSTLVD
jgi:hypothetical protein